MADSLSIDVKTSLNWLFQDALDLATVSDAAKLQYAASLVDGTGTGQADKLWHDQRTLASAASENLDLTNLTSTIFGSTVTINFARVKVILIVNTAVTSGEDLLIGGAGVGGNAWGAPFDGDQDAELSVPADSAILLTNKQAGWVVTNGSSDVLKIANDGTGSITYKIAVVGTSS